MAEGAGIRSGQSAPRRRVAGQWVEVEQDEGTGPEAAVTSEEPEGTDFNKLSRAELDNVARERGLDPAQYGNRDELLAALTG
jgi:hypothetical protein